ncbi:MAG: sugar transferase [Salinivirgaceae bacterium]|nr:sugar transferase [Salinivirgaceae bacterium]
MIALKNLDKNKLLINTFQFTLTLWIFRMVLPGVKYVFIPTFLFFILLIISTQSKSIFRRAYIFEFLKTFNPLLILGVFFFLGIIISGEFYSRAFKDIFEYLINLSFLVIFFALTHRSRKQDGFLAVFRRFAKIIKGSSVIIAVLGLTKFSLQLLNWDMPLDTPFGTAFNQDVNFYALYSFLGVISFYPRLAKENLFKKRITVQISLVILLLNIIFSFSFRSFFILGFILLVLMFFQVYIIIKRHSIRVKLLARNLRLLTVLLVLFFVSVFYGINQSESLYQNLVEIYNEENAIDFRNQEIKAIAQNTFNIDKWEYAFEIFQSQNLIQKLFGRGFNYFEAYGLKFNGDKNIYDYPHNPVLSALLYSGIIGAIFILFFIFTSFYYSVLYFKKYPLFSMMLFVSLMFVSFSGNSLFSVPIFLFLFSLSFLIRHQEISELKLVVNIKKPGSKFIKETFDYIVASIALVALSPILIILSFFIGFTMGWPVVFSQKRIGQNGKSFRLHKFRSMKKSKSNTTVAAQEINRITRLGRIMRKYKLDELPELWNIIRGDMSFVGPRPDVPGYADKLSGEDRIILDLKPGLTGAASLKYMHEEELLAKQEDPQKYNDEVIFPDKVYVNKKYMEKWNLWLDIKIIIYTAMGKSMDENYFL